MPSLYNFFRVVTTGKDNQDFIDHSQADSYFDGLVNSGAKLTALMMYYDYSANTGEPKVSISRRYPEPKIKSSTQAHKKPLNK
jgi:hypothetical protein